MFAGIGMRPYRHLKGEVVIMKFNIFTHTRPSLKELNIRKTSLCPTTKLHLLLLGWPGGGLFLL